jgi:hypothetical protein
MNRLDEVLGPANWWDEYLPQEHSVICRLTIRLPDGTTLTKSDAGGYAGMSDSGDDDKSGFSDAFKHAAVKFGVGRYLYRDGVPSFVQEHHGLSAAAAGAHGTQKGSPDHPSGGARSPSPSRPPEAEAAAPSDGHAAPRSGKALFAWIKQHDERHGTALLADVSGWAKERQFPARMVQWNPEQVEQAVSHVQSAIHADQEPATAQPTPGSVRGRQPTAAKRMV